MSAPLPRVYDDLGDGAVAPVGGAEGPVAPIGGADFDGEALVRVGKDTSRRLESEVLAPMERWANAYQLVQGRMRKLEALRLEVDSRRRTVARLGRKVDGQRARLPQTRAKGEYEMEGTIKVLQHKESKLSACRQSFKEHEALVYHQLTNLIRDTVWLKSYLSAVLRVQAEAFSAANVALGSLRAAAPAAPALPAPGGYGYGESGLDAEDLDASQADHDAYGRGAYGSPADRRVAGHALGDSRGYGPADSQAYGLAEGSDAGYGTTFDDTRGGPADDPRRPTDIYADRRLRAARADDLDSYTPQPESPETIPAARDDARGGLGARTRAKVAAAVKKPGRNQPGLYVLGDGRRNGPTYDKYVDEDGYPAPRPDQSAW